MDVRQGKDVRGGLQLETMQYHCGGKSDAPWRWIPTISPSLRSEARCVDLTDVHGSGALSTVSTPRKSSDCRRDSFDHFSDFFDREGCGGDVNGSLAPPPFVSSSANSATAKRTFDQNRWR